MNANNTRPNGEPGNDHGLAVGAGARLLNVPSESEKASFAAAVQDAQQRFMAAALAEDGIPVSAGWRDMPVQDASPTNDKQFTMIPVPVDLEEEVRELIARKQSA